MCDDKLIDSNNKAISITKRHLLVMMILVECCILTGCVQNVNTAIDQAEVTTCKKSSACAEYGDREINVSPYLLKELTWEMGSGKPKPIDFFDPKAVGTTEGLSEEEIEKFTILTPITDEMLFTRGKYVVKIQCNGMIIEGHISIVDTVPPVIEVPEQIEYEINSNILYKKDVVVSDNSNERLELLVDSSGVKTNIAGTYTVFYSAMDSSGNIGKASSEIIIAKEHEPTKAEADQLADELLESILSDHMTQSEQLKAIFDWCYSNIRYTSDSDKSSILQGAYDGIYFRAGDCYTFYATAAYMMDRCGIENLAVSRKGENATHYWSLVKVDGEWYHFDCSPHKGGFKCFMQTDEQVREYARKYEKEETYFEFDEKEMPERAKKEIYDGKSDEPYRKRIMD